MKRRRSVRRRSRSHLLEALEPRQMLAAWQNPNNAFDVNNDQNVTPLDALVVINSLNRPRGFTDDNGRLITPTDEISPPPFVDVNGDDVLSPIDALIVINVLNRNTETPTIDVGLVNDTGQLGAPEDLITFDPRISGKVTARIGVRSLTVSLDGGEELEIAVDPTGEFEFTPNLRVDGTDDGPHDLILRATDAAGLRSEPVVFQFTFDSTPATTIADLESTSDSGIFGDRVTINSVVGISGLTEPNAVVSIPSSNLVTQADEAGFFLLPEFSLNIGLNDISIQTSDIAGNQSIQTTRVFRSENPDAFGLLESSTFATNVIGNLGIGNINDNRRIRIELTSLLDESDASAALGDVFSIFIRDANSPHDSLLSNGRDGIPIYSQGENSISFASGLVTTIGNEVLVDVSAVANEEIQVVFQLLSGDSDSNSLVVIDHIVDESAASVGVPQIAAISNPVAAGGLLDTSTMTINSDLHVTVNEARVDPETGTIHASVSLTNTGVPTGRDVAIVVKNLPDDVTLGGAAGQLDGNPVLNMRPSIPPGGLQTGASSSPVELVLLNPNNRRFRLEFDVISGGANRPPELQTIDPITVFPGQVFETQLVATDPDLDRVDFRVASLNAGESLPTMRLDANGKLTIRPLGHQVGEYELLITATDGVAETTQVVALSVPEDSLNTTRVSGSVLDVDGTPLAGIQVEIGNILGLTRTDGSFLLDLGNGPIVSETLKIRGETFTDPNRPDADYPFIAEKLPLVLERPFLSGVNNTIPRPIFLPQLDVDSGSTIDPTQDITVTTGAIPNAEVFVAAGTLRNQQGAPFSGVLSITEVPPDLTPAALPSTMFPDLVVTIQPGEMVFTTPAPLTLPNRGGFPAGQEFDLQSINPISGDFDIVGTGRVSNDGQRIETIEGGIRNSSWHFFVPQTPPAQEQANNDPANNPRNQDQLCNDCEGTAKVAGQSVATSEVELHSGALLEQHFLVSYQSLGVDRGLSLHYDSLRADPRPIFHFSAVNVSGGETLVATLDVQHGDLEFQVPGFGGNQFGLQGGEHFWDIPAGTNNVDAALQVDMRDQPTGVYDFNVTFGPRRFSGGRFAGSASEFSTPIAVINSINSPFGAGWDLAGLQQIIENPEGSAMLIDGGGTELLFQSQGAGQPFDSPAGDFSTLEKLDDGTFRRTFTDQTVMRFNEDGRIVSTFDRNSNETSFTYDNDGFITSITDPVGLTTNFTRTGDRVTKITDPAGRETLLSFDSAGNLIRITDPDGSSRQFSYDESHHLTQEINQRGFSETAVYGFHGRVIETVRKDGTRSVFEPAQTIGLFPVELTSDPDTAPTVFIDSGQAIARFASPNGNVTTSILDQAGQVQSQADNEGNLPSVVRNRDNLIVSSQDGRGNATYQQFDDRGNLVRVALEQNERSPTIFDGQVLLSHDRVEMVRLGDLDGDGDLDAVAGHGTTLNLAGSSQFVTIFKNDGGRLVRELDLQVNNAGTENIALADVDGDNRLDILIATGDSANDRFRVMKGNGDFTFSFLSTIALTLDPTAMAVGDVNGDGSPDVIIARGSSSDALLLINDGSGNFTSTELPSGDRQFGVQLADMNGDGNLDAVFAGNNSVRLMLGDGAGNFAPSVKLNTGSQTHDAVAVIDFNNDGRLDIVSTAIFGVIQFFENDGQDGFIESAITIAITGRMEDIAVADLNFDGFQDFVVANGLGDAARVFLNDGLGSFANQPQFVRGGRAAPSVALGDLDQDGDFELLIGNDVSNDVSVVYGKGDGSFLDNPALPQFAGANPRPRSIEMADLNGDGNLDIVTALQTNNTIAVQLGNGAGGFSETIEFAATASPHDLAIGDINADDILDVVVTENGAGRVVALLGQADGSFAVPQPINNTAQALAVEIADVDGDGHADLVLADGGKVEIHFGVSDGTFSDPVSFATTGGGNLVEDDYMQVVDIDGDDDLDVVFGQNAFRILTNNASRQFTLNSFGTNLTFTSVSKAKAADLNGDGHLDLIGLGSGQAFEPRNDRSGIVVRLADGAGGYRAGQAFVAGGQGQDGFAITDFNLDGFLDVVTSTDADNSVAILLGDGTGSFALAEYFNIRSGSESSLSVGDIDRDGDIDIVTPSFDNRNITLLFNHTVFPCQEQFCAQTFDYDPTFSQLTRSVDELGRQRLFEIDPATGNTLRETIVIGLPDATSGETDDLVTQFTYTARGLIATITDPLGRVTDFDYDQQGRLVTTTFAVGTADEATRRTEYDTAGNVTAEIDENNHRTEFHYDALNRLILIRDALLGETEFVYDEVGNVTFALDELDQQTIFEYDTMNRLVKQTDDVGNSSTFAYDNFGNLTRQTDRLNRSTEFRYDARNRLVETINAEGGRSEIEYDADNNPIALTDENTHTTKIFYDQRDRTTHVIDPLNGLQRTLIDAAGFSVTDIDELGRRTDNIRDDADRLIEIRHPDVDGDGPGGRATWQYEFDKAGNQIAETDPLGHTTQFVYDNRDRLIQKIEADPDDAGPLASPVTSFEYDNRSLLTKITDPLGRVTTFEYDAFRRQTRTTAPDPDGPGPQSAPVKTFVFNAVDRLTSSTDPLGNTIAFEYDSLNRRTRTTQPDPDGAGPLASPVLTVSYDADGQVLSVTDPLNRTTSFAYDLLGRQTREIAPDPDGAGPLASPVTQFAYDPVGNLIATVDPLGNQTDFEYDALDRLVRTITADPDGAGQLTRPVDEQIFDAASQLLTTIDPLGRRTDFTYDGLSRVVAMAEPDPDGAGPESRPVTQFEFDLLGNITAIIDPLGNRTENAYDNLNRLIQLTQADPDGPGPAANPVSTMSFDAAGQIISTIDPLGRQTLFQFDNLGRIIETTLPDPDGAGPLASPIYQSRFDLVGNLTSLTDALGRVTTFDYHNLYRQIRITQPDPDGAGPQATPITEFTYDAAGQQLSVSDPLQRVTAFAYDDLGRRVQITYPDPDGAGPLTSPITTFAFDAASNNTSVTDPLGNVTRFEFDDLHRHIRTIDPDPDRAGPLTSPITTMDYDVASQLIAETDPLGRTTTFEYDNLSRLIRRVAPDPDGAGPGQSPSQSFAYDLIDNLLSTTDALGHATTYTYDSLYRRITETDANNDTTSYEYDLIGNRTAVVDPLTNRTTYQYDDLNRLIVATDPLLSTTQFAYDPVNNLVERTDRLNRVTQYTYDDLDRRVQEQWLDAGNVVRSLQFEFDVAGQMLADADPDASHTYQYDNLGRMTQAVSNVSGFSSAVTFDYEYDAVGNKLRQAATIGATADFANDYTFDNLYRKTQIRQSSGGGNAVAEKQINLTYDIAGQISSLDRFADLAGTQLVASSTYVFDLAGRLTDLTHAKGGTNLADYDWTFDAANRITSFDSLTDGLATFTYDDRNQLTAADYATQSDLAFTYDDNGNRIEGGNVVGPNNRTTSDDTFDYEYDAEGNRTKRTNRTSGAVTEYTWDHRNRLIQVVQRPSAAAAVTKIVTHAYDTMNRWVASRVDADGDGPNATEPRFYFYEGNNIVLEFDGPNSADVAHRYLWGVMVDQILADEQVTDVSQPGKILWTLGDHQGTVRDLVEHDAGTDTTKVINHKQYDAFGNVNSETDAAIDSLFGYTGRPFDDATGLQNNLNRWYDAALGKWLSEDPIGFAAGDANLIRYVGNDALRLLDPDGLDDIDDLFANFGDFTQQHADELFENIANNSNFRRPDHVQNIANALPDDFGPISVQDRPVIDPQAARQAFEEAFEGKSRFAPGEVLDVEVKKTFKDITEDVADDLIRQSERNFAKKAAHEVAEVSVKKAAIAALSKTLAALPVVGEVASFVEVVIHVGNELNAAQQRFANEKIAEQYIGELRQKIKDIHDKKTLEQNAKIRAERERERIENNIRIEIERVREAAQDDAANERFKALFGLNDAVIDSLRKNPNALGRSQSLIGINNDLAADLLEQRRKKPVRTPRPSPLEELFELIGENELLNNGLGDTGQRTPGTGSSSTERSDRHLGNARSRSQSLAIQSGFANNHNCPPESKPLSMEDH